MMMYECFRPLFENETIAIVGFGREGKATYKLFRKLFPERKITIADQNEVVESVSEIQGDNNVDFITGNSILEKLDGFSMIIKTPGISLKNSELKYDQRVCSQTDLFLSVFKKQVIGVTGTKGKSTTSSLIYHILKENGKNVILAGNIGISPFELIDTIDDSTIIVYELSSHQLEFVHHSPHISILLNYFQEHLDHYNSYYDYKKAKYNIVRYQTEEDYFIFNAENIELIPFFEVKKPESKLYPFFQSEKISLKEKVVFGKLDVSIDSQLWKLVKDSVKTALPGNHNRLNIMAAMQACELTGIEYCDQLNAVASFNPLEHRIEYFGTFRSRKFFNDSISTIPEAAIAAVNALSESIGSVDTLILGGYDRGIDYSILVDFVRSSALKNILFIGKAGARMRSLIEPNIGANTIQLFSPENYKEVVKIAFEVTPEKGVVLLSPAASSYDMFKNFEERGRYFKQLVKDCCESIF